MKRVSVLLLAVGVLAIAHASGVVTVGAQSSPDPLSGFAWSDTIGWIQFNPTFGGVTLAQGESTRDLSGYAWSDAVGWISFEQSDTNGCPAGSPCRPRIRQNGEAQGWARALSNGGDWDGWISLSCENDSSCGTSNYKVVLNETTGDFSGFAWGSDVVGWVSFNCGNVGGCGTSNYKVTTVPAPTPTVSLDANPASVNSGGSSTLTWSSTGAASCVASNGWSGSKPTSGSQSTGALAGSRTYGLSCTGPGGTGSDSVTVSVIQPDYTLSKSNDIELAILGDEEEGLRATSTETTITVTNPLGGFSSTVSLSATSDIPGSESFNFSDASLSPSEYNTGSRLSVTVPADTPSGSYTVTVRGSGGGLVRTVPVAVNAEATDPRFREQ